MFWEKSVPNFQKIAEAYGIRAATLGSYEDLDDYIEWINDDEPCVFDIPLPEDSLLTPKIKWETCKISPEIDGEITRQIDDILAK